VLLGAGAHFIEYKPKYLPDYTVDGKWLAKHRRWIAAQIATARGRWRERVVVNNQVDVLLDEAMPPSLARTARPCVTSLLRMVVSTHGCYPCTPYRGEPELRLGDILTQSLREVLANRNARGPAHRRCSRICAYDAQNDFLLAMRDEGIPLPPASGRPRPQDRFV
jgi:hypothetical protein